MSRGKAVEPRSHEDHEAGLFSFTSLNIATGLRPEIEKDDFVLFVASW
jgi:hypothetical protein